MATTAKSIRRRIMSNNPRWKDRSGEIEQASIAQPLDMDHSKFAGATRRPLLSLPTQGRSASAKPQIIGDFEEIGQLSRCLRVAGPAKTLIVVVGVNIVGVLFLVQLQPFHRKLLQQPIDPLVVGQSTNLA